MGLIASCLPASNGRRFIDRIRGERRAATPIVALFVKAARWRRAAKRRLQTSLLGSLSAAVVCAPPALTNAMTLQTEDGVVVTPVRAYRVLSAGAGAETLRIEIAKVHGKDSAAVPEIYWITQTPKDYWLAEKEAHGADEGVQWADSRRCPSLVAMAADLDNDATARPAAGDATARRTGPIYEISTLSPPLASIRRTGRAGEPVAVQVQAAVQALSSCWSSERPQLR